MNLYFDPLEFKLQYIKYPFNVYKLSNVFTNAEDVVKLREELKSLKFTRQVNDMYRYFQSPDLWSTTSQTKSKLLKKFLSFLAYFRIFLSKKFNVKLNDRISLSCSKYKNEDYLLCHDDKYEDRFIAFIFYLNSSWKPKWGGSLDMFDSDDKGQPSNISHRFYPEFNSLIFFRVQNHSYHQVSEVISKKHARITLNGWFHSEEAYNIKSLDHLLPSSPFMKLHTKFELRYLRKFINKPFLHRKYTDLIAETIQEMDIIMLQDFLKPDVLEKFTNELSSDSIQWIRKTPANRRKYDVANPDSLPSMISSFLTFCQSIYVCAYFNSICNFNLFKNKQNSSNGSVCAEIQLWKSGYYSLIYDDNLDYDSSTLDILIFLNVYKSTRENKKNDDKAGHIYYYEKDSMFVKHEIEPQNNSICIIPNKKNQSYFVSYISEKSSFKYNVLRLSFKIYER